MSTPTTPATPAKTARSRRRLFAGAGLGTAAAGVVAAIAVGTSGSAVTALTVPTAAAGGPAVACAPVSAESLADSDLAFEADVTAIDDGTVTLEVTHRYQGDVHDEVSVPQQPADQLSEFGPGPFTEGASYLITTDGDVVTGCGASGPASQELRSLYRQAFGG
ncbi:hypothetical protein AB2L28_09085 [Kineococcus sp. TBRC 1896]|uniref:Uncharacterized protein n=1 Tax=Kineococcus mangrovi TaxID=1660183 RepID=A0ABV4I150_9ACTN